MLGVKRWKSGMQVGGRAWVRGSASFWPRETAVWSPRTPPQCVCPQGGV